VDVDATVTPTTGPGERCKVVTDRGATSGDRSHQALPHNDKLKVAIMGCLAVVAIAFVSHHVRKREARRILFP
jgi:hypothetical protein